jgi:light-regulated signal transduction histidine kinase (bacteriophytochrome)
MPPHDDAFIDRLHADVQNWIEQGKPREQLYQEEPLETTKAWARENTVSDEVWEFIEAGIVAQYADLVGRGFLDEMHRRFNSQVALIENYVEVLLSDRQGNLDDRQTQTLHKIAQAAKQLATYRQDLNRYNLLLSNRLVTFNRPVDIAALLDEVLDAIKDQLPAQPQTDIAPDLPPVYTDKNLLRYALTRLIPRIAGYSKSCIVRAAPSDEGVQIELITAQGTMDYRYITLLLELEAHPMDDRHLYVMLIKHLIKPQGGTVWAERSKDKSLIIGFNLPTKP